MSAPAVASEKRPLPEFAVEGLDGAPAPSSALGQTGQWLLIYVGPESAPSQRLLKALKEWESEAPAIGQRTVAVIGASAAEARQFVQKAGDTAPSVRWVADPAQAAWKALRLSGTPTIVGVRDGRIEWMLAGVLNNPATLESVVTSWVTGR